MTRLDKKCPQDPVAIEIEAIVDEISWDVGDKRGKPGFRMTPRDVNRGFCDMVAEDVEERIRGAENVRLIDELFPYSIIHHP